MTFDSIEAALAALRSGSMVVVVDDEDRENEGDIIVAAQMATSQNIAFMVRWSSGVLCVALPGSRLDALDLPLMVAENRDSMKTAFTVTVDYAHGLTTGISAAERATTARALADETCGSSDFTRPGHMFPLRAVRGGVLERPGHTEAAVDLTRLAGLAPGGVLAEIVNADGTMARRPELERFAAEHGLPIITIRDLIRYRKGTESSIECRSEARLPTKFGVFTARVYQDQLSGIEHVALTMGDVATAKEPVVRVHAECLTSEIFGSIRCDCRPQLELAMSQIGAEGCGALVYLRGHEGRGIGLAHKLRVYALQNEGCDTAEANRVQGLPVDARDYSTGAQILRALGISRMRLMTNNPRKYVGLEQYGLEIASRIALVTPVHSENFGSFQAGKNVRGHTMEGMFEESSAVSVAAK